MSELFVGLALLERLSEGESMADIARDIGTTRERVRQLVMGVFPQGPSDRSAP